MALHEADTAQYALVTHGGADILHEQDSDAFAPALLAALKRGENLLLLRSSRNGHVESLSIAACLRVLARLIGVHGKGGATDAPLFQDVLNSSRRPLLLLVAHAFNALAKGDYWQLATHGMSSATLLKNICRVVKKHHTAWLTWEERGPEVLKQLVADMLPNCPALASYEPRGAVALQMVVAAGPLGAEGDTVTGAPLLDCVERIRAWRRAWQQKGDDQPPDWLTAGQQQQLKEQASARAQHASGRAERLLSPQRRRALLEALKWDQLNALVRAAGWSGNGTLRRADALKKLAEDKYRMSAPVRACLRELQQQQQQRQQDEAAQAQQDAADLQGLSEPRRRALLEALKWDQLNALVRAAGWSGNGTLRRADALKKLAEDKYRMSAPVRACLRELQQQQQQRQQQQQQEPEEQEQQQEPEEQEQEGMGQRRSKRRKLGGWRARE